jgi:uroporphyrinogen decarboxylase
MQNKEHLFIRACKREQVERTPIWIMRQAGRYLPEYRAIREKHDFMEMCKTPELAAEVSMQPIDIFGLDAAIIFSDILVIPEAMGMGLQMIESRGPVFDSPIKGFASINKLNEKDISSRLGFVFDAVKMTKQRLGGKTPLIGFSGAPWTLAAYMVEGGGSKNFEKIKSLIYNTPGNAHRLLEKLSTAVSEYLICKIDAGCDAVQIFDTWGGVLAPWDFEEFSLKYINQIINNIKHKGVPIIVFAKGVKNIRKIAETDCDVIGIDWTFDISDARNEINGSKALQGNLDPVILFAEPDKIKFEAAKILDRFGASSGHIFNLGHGILPGTPVENVRALVEFVKERSTVIRKQS